MASMRAATTDSRVLPHARSLLYLTVHAPPSKQWRPRSGANERLTGGKTSSTADACRGTTLAGTSAQQLCGATPACTCLAATPAGAV